jgi:hypothetical protein
MVSHLFCYQLALLALVWLFVVVSLYYADNCGGPFASRLRDVHQLVIRPRIKFSGPPAPLLIVSQAHLSCLVSRSSSLPTPYTA